MGAALDGLFFHHDCNHGKPWRPRKASLYLRQVVCHKLLFNPREQPYGKSHWLWDFVHLKVLQCKFAGTFMPRQLQWGTLLQPMWDVSCTLQEIPHFSFCFWLSVAQLWMLAVQAAERGHVPLGGTIESCAPHKNFILHVPGSWVDFQQGWHGGERSIHKEKLNSFGDVPDHLCVCCQTSKKYW